MRIFFSVGEPSGDLHGANLVRDLVAARPGVECVGYGGPKMAAAGCEIHQDLTKLAVMWIGGAVANLKTFHGLVRRANRYFAENEVDAVVLIDYPGFNWHIARAASRRGIPVFYYGAPQIWAWLRHRIRKMRRRVDHALCKLPFEAKWYGARGVNAVYVGHPYFDEMRRQDVDETFIEEKRRQPGPLVAVLPGSRMQEVKANLDCFLRAAGHVRESVPGARFAVAAFNREQAATARAMAAVAGSRGIPVHVGRTAELIRAADACMACSGSVSLELLYHEKPTVIHYGMTRWHYRLCRYLLCKVRYITLVNLLACRDPFDLADGPYDPRSSAHDEAIFPEYATWEDRSRQVADHVIEWLTDDDARARIVARLADLKRSVAAPGASRRAADYILSQLAPAAVLRDAA